jgi:hypothetical protein
MGSGPTVDTLEDIVFSGHVAALKLSTWWGRVLLATRLEIAAWAPRLHTVVGVPLFQGTDRHHHLPVVLWIHTLPVRPLLITSSPRPICRVLHLAKRLPSVIVALTSVIEVVALDTELYYCSPSQ